MRFLKQILSVSVMIFAIYNLFTIHATVKNLSTSKEPTSATKLGLQTLSVIALIVSSMFILFGAIKSKISFLVIATVVITLNLMFLLFNVINQESNAPFRIFDIGEKTENSKINLKADFSPHFQFSD